MNINRNPTSIVLNADHIVFFQNNKDLGTVTLEGFVDRIIDDFIDEMMETVYSSRPNIHAGSFSYRL
jgi:hypothetical protein